MKSTFIFAIRTWAGPKVLNKCDRPGSRAFDKKKNGAFGIHPGELKVQSEPIIWGGPLPGTEHFCPARQKWPNFCPPVQGPFLKEITKGI